MIFFSVKNSIPKNLGFSFSSIKPAPSAEIAASARMFLLFLHNPFLGNLSAQEKNSLPASPMGFSLETEVFLYLEHDPTETSAGFWALSEAEGNPARNLLLVMQWRRMRPCRGRKARVWGLEGRERRPVDWITPSIFLYKGLQRGWSPGIWRGNSESRCGENHIFISLLQREEEG